MRVVGLILLSLCSFTKAAITSENVAQLGDSIEHNLANSEYVIHSTLEADLFDEDAVAYLFNSLSAQERNSIANQIRDILESFREVIINGNDVVPVLDPFVVDHIGPFLFTATGVRVTGNVRNLKMEGLRWYTVDRVDFHVIRRTLGVQITLPWLIVTGSYDTQASIALFTHRAGGDFRVFVNRFVLNVDTRVGTNIAGGHLVLRSLDIKLDVDDTNIQIHGMVGSSVLNSIINSFLQSFTQETIQNELENVSAMLSEQLLDVVNEVLKEFNLGSILN